MLRPPLQQGVFTLHLLHSPCHCSAGGYNAPSIHLAFKVACLWGHLPEWLEMEDLLTRCGSVTNTVQRKGRRGFWSREKEQLDYFWHCTFYYSLVPLLTRSSFLTRPHASFASRSCTVLIFYFIFLHYWFKKSSHIETRPDHEGRYHKQYTDTRHNK